MSSAKWRPFCLGLNVLTVYMINICVIAGFLFNWTQISGDFSQNYGSFHREYEIGNIVCYMVAILSRPQSVNPYKRLEMHRYVINTVATAALVRKHQAISIHSANWESLHWTNFKQKCYIHVKQN